MLYKAVPPEGRGHQYGVQECDENKRNICFCTTIDDAAMIAGALNMREAQLRRIAISFIESINNGDSGTIMQRWQATVKINELSEHDASELWRMIGQILKEKKA